ncbi:MAG: hypothetical protein AAFR18_16220 [Cyanobacteria bacterium J06627_32]
MSTNYQAINVLDDSIYLGKQSVLKLANPVPELTLNPNIQLEPNQPVLKLKNLPVAVPAPLQAVPPASISRLNSQINKVRFINPKLTTEIVKIAQPSQSVPKSKIKTPISPQIEIVDTVLFDDPADDSKKYYLPRYRLLTLDRRPQIAFTATADAWQLSVQLEKYPAVDISGQISGAEELQHTPSVLLQSRLVRGADTGGRKELVFKEIAVTQQGISAVFPILSTDERDLVYQILTDPEYDTFLVVRRVINVAIPVVSSPGFMKADPRVTMPADVFQLKSTSGLNKSCFPNLPQPRLILKGTEEYTANGQAWKRYQLSVENWNIFPDVLFEPAPDLPPCGLNKNASRTWIDIMSGNDDRRLYGFCALSAPSQLQNLWFAHSRDGNPPDSVYVVMKDRRCDQTYKTNAVRTLPGNGVDLFRSVTRAVDDIYTRRPFVFPPELHPEIFEGITGDASRDFDPHLWQAPWQGQSYSYYQDPVHHQLFYYLPDSFKLVRRPEAPFHPILSVQFLPAGDTNEEMLATVEYWAYPFVDLNRLEGSVGGLKRIAPNLNASDTIEFQPLLAENSRLSVHLPQPDGSQKNEAREDTVVDLRTGFRDSMTLTLENFQRFYDAIFGGSSVLFQGNVSVTLPNRPTENIPLRIQMDDLVGDLLTYQETKIDDPVSIQTTLTNSIESPIRIRQLQVVLQGDKSIPARIEGVDFSQPLVLQPAESLSLTIIPLEPLAEGPANVLFDLDQVSVLPDKQAIWDVILRPDTPAEYRRSITVKTFKEVFGDRIKVISVDFRRAGTVDFTVDTEQLEATAQVLAPVRNLILRESDPGNYEYKVLVILKDGQQFEDASWRTGARESLWITNTELPSMEDG